MTPEQFVIVVVAITGLIAALGTIVVQLYALSKKADAAKDTAGRIEANTNGALAAADEVREELQKKLRALEESLRQAIAESVEDKATAQQAASDVRAAFTSGEKGRAETTEPGPPEEGS